LLKRVLHRWFRCFQHWGYIGDNCHTGKTTELINEKYIFLESNARIGGKSFICCYDQYEGKALTPHLEIGENFFARDSLVILCAGLIKIGNNVSMGGSCFITNESHGTNPLSENYRFNELEISDVIIEDGVWIGEKTIILPGVKIGAKSIIGAGSVVTKDIPPYCIAVGNPCNVIKRWNGIWEKAY